MYKKKNPETHTVDLFPWSFQVDGDLKLQSQVIGPILPYGFALAFPVSQF